MLALPSASRRTVGTGTLHWQRPPFRPLSRVLTVPPVQSGGIVCIRRWYPAGQAGRLMDACSLILCFYWIIFLIAFQCIWNFLYDLISLDWSDSIKPCFLVAYIPRWYSTKKFATKVTGHAPICPFHQSSKLHHFSLSLDFDCTTTAVRSIIKKSMQLTI